MNRMLTVLVALVMVVSITGPAMAVADTTATDSIEIESPAQTADTNVNNTTANETAPGVMLAGSIAAQHAEMQGEIDHRSFGLQIASADTNDSKAQVLNRTQADLETRLSDMETEMEALNASLANGTISESQYQVRMTGMVSQASNLERMANRTNQTAGTLPTETLAANGVNVTALEQLRTHAHNMTGPQTAAMARQIAGNSVGMPMGPPTDVPMGPPEGGHGGPQMGDENDTQMGSGHGGDGRTDDGMMNTTTQQSTSTDDTETTSPTMTPSTTESEDPAETTFDETTSPTQTTAADQ